MHSSRRIARATCCDGNAGFVCQSSRRQLNRCSERGTAVWAGPFACVPHRLLPFCARDLRYPLQKSGRQLDDGDTLTGVAITPGTTFMLDLTHSLTYYVCVKLSGKRYRHLKFEISDGTVMVRILRYLPFAYRRQVPSAAGSAEKWASSAQPTLEHVTVHFQLSHSDIHVRYQVLVLHA